MPKFPQAETQTDLTTPSSLCLPSFEARSAMLKECAPLRLFCTFQVRAKGSSECAVRTSSQSRERVLDQDNADTGGSFREVNGIDSDVAFFASDPGRRVSQGEFSRAL